LPIFDNQAITLHFSKFQIMAGDSTLQVLARKQIVKLQWKANILDV